MSDLAVALGLVLVIEGLFYAAAPSTARRMWEMVREMPDGALRQGGLIAIAAGVMIVWLIRG